MTAMSIAITEDHRALADTVRSFAASANAAAPPGPCSRHPTTSLPEFWAELVELGWLGLHLPEDVGGSGYGIEELVVVVEELAPGGRARAVRPDRHRRARCSPPRATTPCRARLLPGLADGSTVGAVALGGSVTVTDGAASGDAGVVLGAGSRVTDPRAGAATTSAVVTVGDGVDGRVRRPTSTPPAAAARVTLDGAPVTVLAGARRVLVDLARVILSAEAVGVARECTEHGRRVRARSASSSAARSRCTRRSSTTAPTWSSPPSSPPAPCGTPPGRRRPAATSSRTPRPRRPRWPRPPPTCAPTSTPRCTAASPSPGSTTRTSTCAGPRRCSTTSTPPAAAEELTDLTRRGVAREKAVELPPEAEAIRDEVRAFAAEHQGPAGRRAAHRADRDRLRDAALAQAVRPRRRRGRAAGDRAGVRRRRRQASRATASPAWNILTLIQYATQDQIDRWVRPALNQDVIWCQLFSEPDAGSDAAGVKTKATRVDGGWLVNGQKVWTSGAHVAGMGFATVRTNPDVPKHEGITMMVIDMHAEGRRGASAEDDDGQLGVQRGLLQRRVRARRRRGRARSTAAGRSPGRRSATRA